MVGSERDKWGQHQQVLVGCSHGTFNEQTREGIRDHREEEADVSLGGNLALLGSLQILCFCDRGTFWVLP